MDTLWQCIDAQWRATSILLLSLSGYLLLVRSLRYRRVSGLKMQYAPNGRKDFKNMTANDAQSILKTLAELEFPRLYGFSMIIALFRACRPKYPLARHKKLSRTSRHTESQPSPLS